jgi:hypothetical protein
VAFVDGPSHPTLARGTEIGGETVAEPPKSTHHNSQKFTMAKGCYLTFSEASQGTLFLHWFVTVQI